VGTTPDELRNDVESRRAHLAHNVDRLADRVTPSKVARRKVDSVRDHVSGVKERVMGTAHDAAHGTSGSLHQAADSVTETAAEVGGNVQETVRRAPAQIKRQTQGSPLAVGLMAFGAGMLAAALLPTTAVEERAGQQLRDHADDVLEPVKQTAVQAAQEVRDELREPVADAVQSVKGTAQEAVSTTTRHAQQAGSETADGLRQVGRDTAEEVRHDPGAQRPAT
jgi:gas vesicle protein